jgi:hypothetical protein
MARQIGTAFRKLGIPIGEIYTSRLNRAVETGQLLSGKEVRPVDALTDSGAGSAAGMAAPGGGNARAGFAMRQLVNATPQEGTNNLIVTHKTNIADAFGKQASDVQEGEAFIYRSGGATPLDPGQPGQGVILERPGGRVIPGRPTRRLIAAAAPRFR